MWSFLCYGTFMFLFWAYWVEEMHSHRVEWPCFFHDVLVPPLVEQAVISWFNFFMPSYCTCSISTMRLSWTWLHSMIPSGSACPTSLWQGLGWSQLPFCAPLLESWSHLSVVQAWLDLGIPGIPLTVLCSWLSLAWAWLVLVISPGFSLCDHLTVL